MLYVDLEGVKDIPVREVAGRMIVKAGNGGLTKTELLHRLGVHPSTIHRGIAQLKRTGQIRPSNIVRQMRDGKWETVYIGN